MSLICPYNSSHKVGKKRFGIHKMTCPNRPPESQILIKPIVENNIQDIRVGYMRKHGGIQPQKIANESLNVNKKKRKLDIVAQLNDMQILSQESIENRNYSDIIARDIDCFSYSNTYIEDNCFSNPMTGNSQIDPNEYLLGNKDIDYDPNREDDFISKNNKNMIALFLIEKYMKEGNKEDNAVNNTNS